MALASLPPAISRPPSLSKLLDAYELMSVDVAPYSSYLPSPQHEAIYETAKPCFSDMVQDEVSEDDEVRLATSALSASECIRVHQRRFLANSLHPSAPQFSMPTLITCCNGRVGAVLSGGSVRQDDRMLGMHL